MAKKAQNKSRKLEGRTIASSLRRFRYDAGGRKPLTQYPLCPITVVVLESTKEEIEALSQKFIDPINLKPYGIAALCRVLLHCQLHLIDAAPRLELIDSESSQGLPGRPGFKEKTKRIQLLIPKHIVDRVNDRVIALNDTLIGTATALRWLIMRSLKETNLYTLYEHIPTHDMATIIKEKLTVDTLIARYQKNKK